MVWSKTNGRESFPDKRRYKFYSENGFTTEIKIPL